MSVPAPQRVAPQYFGNVANFGNSASVLAVGIICIAAAAHQAWSANLFTTVSDMFPKKTVGSVTGIGAWPAASAAWWFSNWPAA